MSKPSPENFARVVLYNLAGQRAEFLQLQAKIDAIAKRVGLEQTEEDRKAMDAARAKIQKEIYSSCLKAAHIPEDPDEPDPPFAFRNI